MAKLKDATPDEGPNAAERYASIDALRGLLLLLIVAKGFGLLHPRQQMLNPNQWNWIIHEFVHRDWIGCSLWDLLQPGMLFVVGLAMSFSYARRQAKGQSWPRQLVHALLRASVLLVVGIYLDSYQANRLVLDPRGDLQQIAVAYLLAFFLLPLGMPVHGVTIGFLLIGHTAAYVIHAVAGGQELWSRQHNLGITIDHLLRLPLHPNRYVTFNALPATAIVTTGVLIAGLIRSGLSPGVKVLIMTTCSFAAILFAWLLSGGDGWIDFAWPPLIPMIKRIGTLTFVLAAVGWMLLLFAYCYTLMEGFGWHSWALPITLVGRNSLFLFGANVCFHDWAARSARLLSPDFPPIVLRLQPLVVELIVVLIFWLLCLWLYRRRIFLKV